jgi:LPXTG-motif cell wall-anchored protein
MKRRLGFGVLCLAIAGIAPLFARASAPNDWVLATFVTDPATAMNVGSGSGGGSFGLGPGFGPGASLDVLVRAHGTGTGPVLLGFGASFGPFGFVDVFERNTGGIHLRTTQELGAVDVQVQPGDDPGAFKFGAGIGTSSGGGRRLAILLFATNAVIDSYSIDSSGGSTPQVHAGSGSRAIEIAGPEASGVAVDASVAAAGTSTVGSDPHAGLVGGVLWGCTRCTVSWTTPDHHDGSFTQTNPPSIPVPLPLPPVPLPPIPFPPGLIAGDTTFAGPAGSWTWSWTGANLRADYPGPTMMGAYAPVGDLYSLFRESGPGQPLGGGKPPASGGAKTKVKAEKKTRTLANTGVGRSTAAPALLGSAVLLAGWLSLSGRRKRVGAPR